MSRMQVAMATHLLLLNTVFLLLVVTLQVSPDVDFWQKFLVDEAESFWAKLGVIADDWQNMDDHMDDLSKHGDPGFCQSHTPDLHYHFPIKFLIQNNLAVADECSLPGLWLAVLPTLVCLMTSARCCSGCSKSG